jgi:hypothetical protein
MAATSWHEGSLLETRTAYFSTFFVLYVAIAAVVAWLAWVLSRRIERLKTKTSKQRGMFAKTPKAV